MSYKVPPNVTMTATMNGERPKTPVDEAVDYVYKVKGEIESAKYGENVESVKRALQEQKTKQQQIKDYEREIKKLLRNNKSEDKKKSLEDAYESLKDVSEKKIACLENILAVTTLQDACQNLANVFDKRAVNLVDIKNRNDEKDQKGGPNLEGFIAPSSQDCVFALEDNWDWIVTCVKCIDTHLKNDSNYHQFFHEIDESIGWMNDDLRRLHQKIDMTPLDGDVQDAKKLMEDLSEVLVCLRQWEVKTDKIWDRGQKIVPVHLRTDGIEEPVPARALCHYNTGKYKVREGQDLLLLNNTNGDEWLVRDGRGDEFTVPSIVLVLPGPFKAATDAAAKMRMQLLAAWTDSIKKMGMRLISFMLKVFKSGYGDDEISAIQSIDLNNKGELNRILDYIEDTLKVHWADHAAFKTLQEWMTTLRYILLEGDENEVKDEDSQKLLVSQVQNLEGLMKKYKEMWRDWEKFKVGLEASQAPELMLIVNQWEQLKFVSKQYFTQFWQNDLKLSDKDQQILQVKNTADLQSVPEEGFEEEGFDEEVIKETKETLYESVQGQEEVDGNFGFATEEKRAETEQLDSSEREETKKFVIKSVIDTRTGDEISLDDAIMAGLIKPAEGNFYNMETGEVMPIPVAMSSGLIKVEFTSTRSTKEKKSSFGIITDKRIIQPERKYAIKTVKDTLSGEDLEKDAAKKRGIFDGHTFTDRKSRKVLAVSDAIERGLIAVEYETAAEPEIIQTQYLVRAVVDTLVKSTITFGEAVRRGIINRDSGAFKDTATGKTMYVGDAIKRGFLKARVIEDTSSLNIDPENKMVIDKTEAIRKKLLRPLKVISAFRKAAMFSASGASK